MIIDYYSPKYENLILIGDFNVYTENQHLDALIQAYNLNDLINKPTCFQSNQPTCIDLILTNKKICSNHPVLLRLVFRTIIN